MAYLAFVGITLIGVVDSDFFQPERRTELPLVGVTIPTGLFFYIAPVLGLLLYAHLHFYLMRLWRSLARPNAPAIDQLVPWLVVDYVAHIMGAQCYRFPLQWLANLVVMTLVFLATPIMLACFWWRSMPKHDGILTIVFCGGSFFLSILIWAESNWVLRLGRGRKSDRRRSIATDIGLGIAFVLIPSIGFVRSVNMWPLPIGTTIWPSLLAKANLAGSQFVNLPGNWLEYDEAREKYWYDWCEQKNQGGFFCIRTMPVFDTAAPHQNSSRDNWCRENGSLERDQALADCHEQLTDTAARFREDWGWHRKENIKKLSTFSLQGVDLRGANLVGARLDGINMFGANLERANLSFASLEGVDLATARLDKSILRFTRMQLSTLILARLDQAHIIGADLSQAGLAGANFSDAWIHGASLHDADLGDEISIVDPDGVSLMLGGPEASFQMNSVQDGNGIVTSSRGAALFQVDLSTAHPMQNTVNEAFGDASVVLPDHLSRPKHWPDWEMIGGKFVYEWRRWRADPANYRPPPRAAEADSN